MTITVTQINNNNNNKSTNRSKRKNHHNTTNKQTNKIRHTRIILLLDLDCFYAQCETVRLGLPRSMPVCLLQWNSALAVNYPARAFGLKRGASFEEIQRLSQRQCIALHLPVVSHHSIIQDNNHNNNNNDNDDNNDSSNGGGSSSSSNSIIAVEYNKEFNKSKIEKRKLFHMEKNKMRYPGEGKASLDRYRLASSRIFEVLLEALCDYVGKGNFILEKASIDELYLDVTEHCHNTTNQSVWKKRNDSEKSDNNNKEDGDNLSVQQLASKETITVCGDTSSTTTASSVQFITPVVNAIESNNNNNSNNTNGSECYNDDNFDDSDSDDGDDDENGHDNDDDENEVLQRGCIIARGLRREVYNKLQFTLSAGIGTSKLVAKLGASFGKPNGQAVVFPQYIPELMKKTKIKKVRNLGGKIGDKVLKLLPQPDENDHNMVVPPIMDSIIRYLSLHQLVAGLNSYDTGKFVYDACRGIDDEPVRETKRALTKSITAFKSFVAKSSKEVIKWITLLVTDLLIRLKTDTIRNSRFPTAITIQYYYYNNTNNSSSSSSNNNNNPVLSAPVPTPGQQQQSSAGSRKNSSRRDTRICKSIRISITQKELLPVTSTHNSNNSNENLSSPSSALSLLTKKIEELLTSKIDVTKIVRLGLCAIGFRDIGSIGKFFICTNNKSNGIDNTNMSTNESKSSNILKGGITTTKHTAQSSRYLATTQTQQSVHTKDHNYSVPSVNNSNATPISFEENGNENDPDLSYAKRLQAMFDREDNILSLTQQDKNRNTKKNDSISGSSGGSSTAGIMGYLHPSSHNKNDNSDARKKKRNSCSPTVKYTKNNNNINNKKKKTSNNTIQQFFHKKT